MKDDTRRTAPLGDLIVALYDEAAQHSTNPRVVSSLATRALLRMLRRAGWAPFTRFQGGMSWST